MKKEIIVATGSQPRSVPGIEIDRKRIITSDEAINMKTIPKSIVIMGSGAVGVEFASIFRRFGSEVTVVELLPRLVPVEDEAVSTELERSFKKQGIKVMTGTKVTSAKAGANGVDLEAQAADGKSAKLSAEFLLVATGRGPVTSGLGAEDVGLQMDRGYIRVDAQYSTNVPGISAVGDVITFEKPGHQQLAHLSSAEGVILAERIAGHEFRPINYDHVPGCTYCDPEIGSVGLTEAKAKERGFDVQIGTFKFGVLGRAKIAGETEGFVKIVADKKYDEVLGVHMIGPALDRAGRRSDAGAAPRVHGRRADPHHPRASDDVGGCRRGRSRYARSGHSLVASSFQLPASSQPEAGNRMREAGSCEPEAVSWKLIYGHQRCHAPDGRVDRRRDHRPLDQEGRRQRRPRRAALRDLDRQGGRGDPVARRRRADGDQGQGRGDGPRELGRRGDRRCGCRSGASQTAPTATASLPRSWPSASRRLRSRQPDAGSPAAGSRQPEAGSRQPEAGSGELEADGRQRSSPLVRRIAKEHNVDIRQISGTGISGRVTKNDILGFIQTVLRGSHGARLAALRRASARTSAGTSPRTSPATRSRSSR